LFVSDFTPLSTKRRHHGKQNAALLGRDVKHKNSARLLVDRPSSYNLETSRGENRS
jgi:hypothetical protein